MRRAAICLVLSCTPSAPTTTAPTTATSTPSTSPTPPTTPSAAPPTSQADASAVLARACATQCADDLASLTVYRDDAGAVGVVTVQGSPMRCSHPPLRFIGPDGAERAVIPLVPVAPGSPQAARFDAIREEQTGKLHKAETLVCRDVKR